MLSSYLIVHKSILPEYYEKVIQARHLLEDGKINIFDSFFMNVLLCGYILFGFAKARWRQVPQGSKEEYRQRQKFPEAEASALRAYPARARLRRARTQIRVNPAGDDTTA